MFDFQPWIERTFGKWTFRELGLAFAVVLAVILCFDLVRPRNEAVIDAGVTQQTAVKRWLDRDDPRGFLPQAALGKPGPNDGRYDIAWISGSPISIRKAPPAWRLNGSTGYEMTDVLARYLVSLDGEPVRVQEYLLQGVRMGDMRRAVLFAAHQPEIDAYIVEANPVWMLNDFLQFTLSRQRASILGLPGVTAFDYGVMARLLRPHEVGFELLGAVVPAVRDRFALFGDIPIPSVPPFPLRRAEIGARDGQMVGTWMRWLFPEIDPTPISEEAKSLKTYRNLMLMSNLDQQALGMRIFAANLQTLAATGKPVVVFMPPLNPNLKTDVASATYVRSMTAALNRLFVESGTTNITFQTDTVWAEPKPAEYLDILHLRYGQGVIDLVVSLLEERIGKPFEKRQLSDVYGPSIASDASPPEEIEP